MMEKGDKNYKNTHTHTHTHRRKKKGNSPRCHLWSHAQRDTFTEPSSTVVSSLLVSMDHTIQRKGAVGKPYKTN